MRVFLTGGTGFLGSEVARLLRERGDDVRVLVRDPGAATALRALGCELVEGDLSDEAALVEHCRGTAAVVHCAAVYEVGVLDDRREVLVETNVRGTERLLGAALTAGVARAVHVSTVAVFGDTGGRVADEHWVRDPAAGWTSEYDRSKSVAHGRALEIAARGLPTVVVQPGVVYGPGDRSSFGEVLERYLDGRLAALPLADLGVCPVHRDDAAEGVVRALDKGVPGQSYVLAGLPVRVRDVLELLSELTDRRPPRVLPTALLRALAPVGPLVGPALGLPPNLRELLTSADGVTFWASSDKAAEELGWTARPLVEGLLDLVRARIPAPV